jgi:hypothetical protein
VHGGEDAAQSDAEPLRKLPAQLGGQKFSQRCDRHRARNRRPGSQIRLDLARRFRRLLLTGDDGQLVVVVEGLESFSDALELLATLLSA